MNFHKLPPGGVALAFTGWLLLASTLAAQPPAGYSPGVSPFSGPTFGATGYGVGPYGGYHPLSLGISGGGGGGEMSGPMNRFGRPTAPESPGPVTPDEDVAQLRVLLPSRDALVWVNEIPTRKKGTDRRYLSPFLEPGRLFIYDIKARWTDRDGRVVERSRTVTVSAGSETTVDFTLPAPRR